jgi:ATP-dependent Lon protease
MSLILPESTKEVKIPSNPIEMVIGQDEAVNIAKIAAKQRRHLLLVGPPGCGKSMVAQAMACLLPKPNQEVAVRENIENNEKPVLEVRNRFDVENEKKMSGIVMNPKEVPAFVSERLGYRCGSCGEVASDPTLPVCSNCGAEKFRTKSSPFDDFMMNPPSREDRVYAVRKMNNREEKVMYERGIGGIIFYDGAALAALENQAIPKRVIIPLNRNNFVQATGASETELLGDVRHDPYGGHPEIGIKTYKRVIPGAIHVAHEGILFIDEISNLGNLQRFIFTAMQEKKFPIVGRNPTSSGASVRVDDVPCDFILVGALNFGDIQYLLPPLRSRIIGNGYEILLNTVMPNTPKNTNKIIQFIAQEIRKDGKIPHANKEAVKAIIDEARRRAKTLDGKDGLTLRLRGLSGIIKLAGDAAMMEKSEFIDKRHIESAILKAKTIEQQAEGRYGMTWRTITNDENIKMPESGSVI